MHTVDELFTELLERGLNLYNFYDDERSTILSSTNIIPVKSAVALLQSTSPEDHRLARNAIVESSKSPRWSALYCNKVSEIIADDDISTTVKSRFVASLKKLETNQEKAAGVRAAYKAQPKKKATPASEVIQLWQSNSTIDHKQAEYAIKQSSDSVRWSGVYCKQVQGIISDQELDAKAKSRIVKSLSLLKTNQAKAMAVMGDYRDGVTGTAKSAITSCLQEHKDGFFEVFVEIMKTGERAKRVEVQEAFASFELTSGEAKRFVEEAKHMNQRMFARRRAFLELIGQASNVSGISTTLDGFTEHHRSDFRLAALSAFMKVSPKEATKSRLNLIGCAITEYAGWQQITLGVLALAHMASAKQEHKDLVGNWIYEAYHFTGSSVARTAVVCALKNLDIGLEGKMLKHWKATKGNEKHITAYVKAGRKNW